MLRRTCINGGIPSLKLRKSLLLLLLGILVGTIGTALFLLKHPDYDP